MGRYQKSATSGVSARWVFVLCISSFLLGVLVVNRFFHSLFLSIIANAVESAVTVTVNEI